MRLRDAESGDLCQFQTSSTSDVTSPSTHCQEPWADVGQTDRQTNRTDRTDRGRPTREPSNRLPARTRPWVSRPWDAACQCDADSCRQRDQDRLPPPSPLTGTAVLRHHALLSPSLVPRRIQASRCQNAVPWPSQRARCTHARASASPPLRRILVLRNWTFQMHNSRIRNLCAVPGAVPRKHLRALLVQQPRSRVLRADSSRAAKPSAALGPLETPIAAPISQHQPAPASTSTALGPASGGSSPWRTEQAPAQPVAQPAIVSPPPDRLEHVFAQPVAKTCKQSSNAASAKCHLRLRRTTILTPTPRHTDTCPWRRRGIVIATAAVPSVLCAFPYATTRPQSCQHSIRYQITPQATSSLAIRSASVPCGTSAHMTSQRTNKPTGAGCS